MPVTAPHTHGSWRPRHAAIERLVPRHDRRLRRVARAYGLSTWDVDDVVQATWLQYLEHGDALREPAALGAWLETTARRLSLRLLQRRVREQLTATGDASAAVGGAADPSAARGGTEPERELLAAERRSLLFGALAGLPDRQGRLMRMLVLRPELSYEEVGRRLAMPVGSIGPTRARCLDRLSRDRRLRALQAA
jgi:RNA polymerase sigma factor (sigma-70 family)